MWIFCVIRFFSQSYFIFINSSPAECWRSPNKHRLILWGCIVGCLDGIRWISPYYWVLGWILNSRFMFCCQFLGENTCFLFGSKIFLSRTQFLEKPQGQRLSSIIFPAYWVKRLSSHIYERQNKPDVWNFNLFHSRAQLESGNKLPPEIFVYTGNDLWQPRKR